MKNKKVKVPKTRENFDLAEIMKYISSPAHMKILGTLIRKTVDLVEEAIKPGPREGIYWSFATHRYPFTLKKLEGGGMLITSEPGDILTDTIAARVCLYKPRRTKKPKVQQDLDGKVVGVYSEIIFFGVRETPRGAYITVYDFELSPENLAADVAESIRRKTYSRYSAIHELASC